MAAAHRSADVEASPVARLVVQPPSSLALGGRVPSPPADVPLVPDVPLAPLLVPEVPLLVPEVPPLVPDDPDAPLEPASEPASDVVAPVTEIVRVATATPSPLAALLLLALTAATYIVTLPFWFGALYVNVKVPVAPAGGGVTAPTSSGCEGKGMRVFVPAVAAPALNAAFIDVVARVPLTFTVMVSVAPAVIEAGEVIASVTPPPALP